MSDDEDDYKYKKRKKYSDNEEEEEVEEENEEEEEESNNNQIENEKDEKKNQNNDNNTNKENEIKLKSEYIAFIEGLENELELEKNINNKLKDNYNSDEIQKLKSDLKEKTTMLNKLLSTHKEQKTALSLLTKQLDKENKKRLKKKIRIKNISIRNDDDTDRSIEETSKEQAINIVLNVKNKELSAALKKMKALKSENEVLKKLLYENEDYNNNINIEDKTKEINEKIEKYNDEKNILVKQLKIHKKCIEEQKEYNDKYDNLKEELKDIKKNIQNVRGETLKLINDNQKNIFPNNNLYLGSLSQNSILTNNTSSSPNIHITKNKIRNRNNNGGLILPLITSQTIEQNQNESLLNDSFKKRIKDYLNDEDEYFNLIDKINSLENNRKLIENKHKTELKQFNTQIATLNEQFQILNGDSKSSNCNIRILKYKLNTIKGDNKIQIKKFNDLKKELQTKINLSKKKDFEISLLTGQINKLRKHSN